MAERYTKLLSLPDNQYIPGAPVLIAAGALLRDNETGKILAQVKFKNISPNEIVAVKVSITASDVAGHPVRGVSEYQYLDLKARRDAAFGQKQAIPLPDNTTRNIAVSCTSVIFTDGTAWESIPGAKWKPLPKQQRLEELLQDSKLADQYRRDTTEQSLYVPLRYGDIWLCTCGGVNRGGEAKCHRCNLEKQRMAAALNPATLHKHSDAYHKAVAAKEKKQRRKTILFCGIAAGIIAVVLLVTQVVLPTVKNNSAYRSAVALMESGKYEEAIAAFEAMDGYKDAQSKIEECESLWQQKNEAEKEAECASRYQAANELMEAGHYEEALTAFEALGDYEDTAQKMTECEEAIKEGIYQEALSLISTGKNSEALDTLRRISYYKDAKQKIRDIFADYAEDVSSISTSSYTAAVIADGTVRVAGSYEQALWSDISDWKNITAVSCGVDHIVGLKSDGTVMAAGQNEYGQCDVSDWSDIVAIAAGCYHTVGLRSDGTVLSTGEIHLKVNGREISEEMNLSDWNEITAISSAYYHVLGLKSDGTVVASGYDGSGICDVSDWRNIVAVSTGVILSAGLKEDGTVIAIGSNYGNALDASNWSDIIAISVGASHIIGLKKDGTVVAAGDNSYGQCNVSTWSNIVAISAGAMQTIGLKSDGTIITTITTESNFDSFNAGQWDVSDWRNIRLP